MGHPVYHEGEREAGVAMALSITPNHDRATRFVGVCEELRTAAGLKTENGDDLRLETIFVVPYKGMAVEGYYWPNDGTLEEGTLVPATPSRGERSIASWRAPGFRPRSSTRRRWNMRFRVRPPRRSGT